MSGAIKTNLYSTALKEDSMFDINPNLDTEKLKIDFKENRSIQIFDFLTPNSANLLYDFLNKGMPEDWWSTSVLVNDSGKKGYKVRPQHFRRKPENLQLIEDLQRGANKSFVSGRFCYSFDRTLHDHNKNCPCKECSFRKFLNSKNTIGLLSHITGMDIKETGEVFASRYKTGQFLSPHHDQKKGQIGFVYNITKNWKPQYGGALHFMSNDYNTVTKAVFPTFNRVTVFDIVTRDGVPHFVSHVAPGIREKRISIIVLNM